MLPKRHRLTTRAFDAVWQRGTQACGAFVCVRVIGATAPAYSCVAGKRIARTHVARNRIRRRLYGALFHIYRELPPLHGIIIARANITDADPRALQRDITRTIRKAMKSLSVVY